MLYRNNYWKFTIRDVSELNDFYGITNRYVITNNNGSYVSLDDFSGNKLYLSFNSKCMYMDINRNINQAANRKIISGIYSFK